MNRRNFLQLIASGSVGAMTLDVEKLLWVPGAKTFFLPPVPLRLLTVDYITRETLRILKNNLVFSRAVDDVIMRKYGMG